MNNLLSNKMALAGVLAVVIVVLAVVFVLGGGDSEESPVPEGFTEVKIGTIGPLTGNSASFGTQINRVLNSNLAAMNAIGEPKKIVFSFVHEDGGCNSEDALAAYNKLTKEDNVQFIIGGACSAETLAIGDALFEESDTDVLVLSPSSSNVNIEGKNPYLFSLSYSDDIVATAIANEMSQHSRVAIITEDTDYTTGLTDSVKFRLQESETTEIVVDEVFSEENPDFVTILADVKAANPDAIFLNPNIGANAQSIVREMAAIGGWDGVALYGQFSYISPDVLAESPEITNGMVIIDAPQVGGEGFATVYEDLTGEAGALADLGPYYTAASLDASTLLARLITEHSGNDAQANDEASGDTEESADNDEGTEGDEGTDTEDADSDEDTASEESTDTDSSTGDMMMVATAEMVRDALVSQAQTGYYLGTIDFTNTSFVSGIGVGKYVVEEGVAVWQEAYVN